MQQNIQQSWAQGSSLSGQLHGLRTCSIPTCGIGIQFCFKRLESAYTGGSDRGSLFLSAAGVCVPSSGLPAVSFELVFRIEFCGQWIQFDGSRRSERHRLTLASVDVLWFFIRTSIMRLSCPSPMHAAVRPSQNFSVGNVSLRVEGTRREGDKTKIRLGIKRSPERPAVPLIRLV